MTNISLLIDNYYSWLKDKTAWKNVNEWIEITSPYLDRNNDYIQIYLKKTNNKYLLTDDGETISGLKQEGCNLDSPKRRELLQLTLRGYGVSEDSGHLKIKAESFEDFPLSKHSLVQAILAVNDMFYMTSAHIISLFFEDVRNWLNEYEIRYTERIPFKGQSNYTRNFDFLIPKSQKQPERLIKTINNPIKTSADSIIIDWLDTKDMRPKESKLYTFINDNKRKESRLTDKVDSEQGSSSIGKVFEALKQYEINPVLWSNRDRVKNELAA